MKEKPIFKYYYMGQIEKGPRYTWRNGYSLDAKHYPWLTYREAQRDAKNMGGKAVFINYWKKQP